MFYSCPHCRDLVATDRDTRLPPVSCPRCGGVLREPEREAAAPAAGVDRRPSFASMLRGDDPAEQGNSATDATAAAATAEVNALETVQHAPQAALALSEQEQGDATANPIVEESPLLTVAAPAPPAVSASPPPQAAPLAHAHVPSFTRRPAGAVITPHAAKWHWVAVFLLAALLLVQVLVADRARLAADAGWRPMISALCGVLGCSLPAWHQPGAISMLSRDVRPLAGNDGGLEVRATFRNDARWPQAWPVLLLSLSDADGRVLGSRAFLPREYLGPTQTQTELAPGQSAGIALKLHEPNPGVVAFSFDFR